LNKIISFDDVELKSDLSNILDRASSNSPQTIILTTENKPSEFDLINLINNNKHGVALKLSDYHMSESLALSPIPKDMNESNNNSFMLINNDTSPKYK
jgi:hypothetical protein